MFYTFPVARLSSFNSWYHFFTLKNGNFDVFWRFFDDLLNFTYNFLMIQMELERHTIRFSILRLSSIDLERQLCMYSNPKSKNFNFWPLGSQNLKIWPLDFSNFQKFLNLNFPVTLLLNVMKVSCRNSQSMSRIIVLTIPMTGRHFNSSPCITGSTKLNEFNLSCREFNSDELSLS